MDTTESASATPFDRRRNRSEAASTAPSTAGREAEPSPCASAATSSASRPEADALDRADMQRLAGGEDRALEALMERHATRVFNFLNRLLGNPSDAEDLAQETFARVYRARGRFHPRRRFTAWLYTIAANLARNHVRWRTRHPEVALDPDPDVASGFRPPEMAGASATPAEQLEAGERAAAVRAAVQRLPEGLREVIVLCEWEDLGVTEAAAVLGTTAKAVESKLYRARRQLRETLRQMASIEDRGRT